MTTIAVLNEKGGVAKTTSALNLGVALGRLEHRVLLVDLDPQGNLTELAGVDLEDDDATIIDVLLGTTPIGAVVRKDVFDGVDVLPSRQSLFRFEQKLEREFGREYVLGEVLQPAKEVYDFIIIDNAPSRSLLLHNSLWAADRYLIPTTLETFSLDSVDKVLDTIELAQKHLRTDIACAGLLPTKADLRHGIQKDALVLLKERFGDSVFDTTIPLRTQVEWACAARTSVVTKYPGNLASMAYKDLAKEVQARVS